MILKTFGELVEDEEVIVLKDAYKHSIFKIEQIIDFGDDSISIKLTSKIESIPFFNVNKNDIIYCEISNSENIPTIDVCDFIVLPKDNSKLLSLYNTGAWHFQNKISSILKTMLLI